jgi:hypothetical protein
VSGLLGLHQAHGGGRGAAGREAAGGLARALWENGTLQGNDGPVTKEAPATEPRRRGGAAPRGAVGRGRPRARRRGVGRPPRRRSRAPVQRASEGQLRQLGGVDGGVHFGALSDAEAAARALDRGTIAEGEEFSGRAARIWLRWLCE